VWLPKTHWANSTKGLNSRLSPTRIAETMNSKSGRRGSGTSSSMESAANVTCPVASPTFLYYLSAKCAISSSCMMKSFGLTGIKAFRAVSTCLPKIMSQPARCATQSVLISVYPL